MICTFLLAVLLQSIVNMFQKIQFIFRRSDIRHDFLGLTCDHLLLVFDFLRQLSDLVLSSMSFFLLQQKGSETIRGLMVETVKKYMQIWCVRDFSQ